LLKIYLLVVLLFSLSACSSSDGSDEMPHRDLLHILNDETYAINQTAVNRYMDFQEMINRFPTNTISNENPTSGGTLSFGMVRETNDKNFTGMHHPFLITAQGDALIANILLPNLLAITNYGRFIIGDNHDGPIILSVDVATNTITLSLREGVRIFWHDGVELTLDDMLFALEQQTALLPMGRTHTFRHQVIGAYDFSTGATDYISGAVLSEDMRLLTMTISELRTSLLSDMTFGIPLPRHHLYNISTTALYLHPNSRENFLGFGPFAICSSNETNNNQLIRLTRNDNYWQGIPVLETILFKCLPEDELIQYLHNNIIHVTNHRISDLLEYNHSDHLIMLGTVTNAVRNVYFSVGSTIITRHPSEDIGCGTMSVEFIPRDDGHPIGDYNFRRALSYAWNQQNIIEEANNSLSTLPSSFHHPFNGYRFINRTHLQIPDFNLNQANQLLDESGYKWGNDGYRLNLEGYPFYVNIGMIFSGESELLFKMHRENFKEIGIDLRMYQVNGEHYLLSSNEILAATEPHNSNMHMFVLDSIIGQLSQVERHYWHRARRDNVNVFMPDELYDVTSIILDIASLFIDVSPAANTWNNIMVANMPWIPGAWYFEVTPVNDRIANWSIEQGTFHKNALAWHNVGFIN